MSTSDNNLLGFLQKQSLFNSSPNKNVNRKMSSRSREKRSEQLWQGSPNNLSTPNFTAHQNVNTSATFTAGQNFNNNSNFTTGVSLNAGQNFTQGQNGNFQINLQDNNVKVHYNNPNQFGSTSQNQQFGQVDYKVQSNGFSPNKFTTQTTQNIQNSFQTNTSNGFNNFNANIKLNQQGLSTNNYSYNTYQQQIIRHPGSQLDSRAQNYLQNVVHYAADSTNYAREQAMKRLTILTEKVKFQLNSLNSKLEGFNAQMMNIVIAEFNFVKGKVYEILQDCFRENQKYCRGYISTIQTEFNEDVLKARAALQREMENIELMKIDINKPHWESNAVFVSVQFEARVNKVVDQVKGIEVKSIQHHTGQAWEMNLKRDLLDRVILRLQKEREAAFGRAL